MQRIYKQIFPKILVGLKHTLLDVAMRVKGLVAAANLADESTQSNRTFYFISLMLFISLLLVAPDKIPQTFTISQVNPEVLDKVQEIVKKALPFIG